MEKALGRRVKGQEDAIKAVSEAVRLARTGLGNPNRPVGSFLFVGPSGTGKTELAKSHAVPFAANRDTGILPAVPTNRMGALS